MAELTISLSDEQFQRLRDTAQHEGITPQELVSKIIDGLAKPQENEETLNVRTLYPHMAKVFGPAGWDDPEMDAYNALDPRKQV